MAEELFIGVAGWSYPDWEGVVYPRGCGDRLEFLSRFVDCIEINSTFYRPAQSRHARSWLERTREREGFFFTAKLQNIFTHEGSTDRRAAGMFIEGLLPLAEAGRLGGVLMQFRYDYDDSEEHRRHLMRLAELFGRFSLVVEVRHQSWHRGDGPAFLDGLGVTTAHLDYPVGRDSFDSDDAGSGPLGYLRMHGRNAEKWFSKSSRDETYDYYYSEDELEEVEERIGRLTRLYRSVVVITNNHYRGAALANALELKAKMTGDKVDVPEDLMDRYPRLGKIAKNPPLF